MSNDVAASMDQDFSNTPGGCHRGFFASRPGREQGPRERPSDTFSSDVPHPFRNADSGR